MATHVTLRRPARLRLVVAASLTVLAALAVPGARAASPEPYVAVGDSYTAGPVIPNQLADPLGCWRSDHDYPHLVAAALGAALRDRSCSGAVTGDLTSPQAVLGGPNPPQLDALDRGVGTVTIQIGGNDIHFTEIIQRCVAVLPVGTPCQDFYRSGGSDEISRRISETGPKLAAVLAEARRRSPTARLFVLGYPAILPEGQQGCWPLLPIAPADVTYLRDKEKELDTMLAGRAAAAGATYVDLYGPSQGHDACQLPGTRWIEPLVPLAPAAPVHPNALGMQGMAGVVAAALAR